MQRLLRAALVLCCATVRAATGFPELPGFFTETSAGVYQAHGARLAVVASGDGVRIDGVALRHLQSHQSHPVGIDPLPGLVRTYKARSVTESRAYRAIDYPEIYPGITLRLSFEGRSIKADYLVAAGADFRPIAFRYEGIQATLQGGDLVAGALHQPAPVVLQPGREPTARYTLDEENWVRFEMEGHDTSLPLVIDPYVIAGSAYFGGTLADRIAAITTDTAGYIYVAGSTESTDFTGSFLRPRANSVEAFVLKLHPTTLQMVYATYLGGTGDDRASAIAVDSSGSAYIAGFTGSTDFPATHYTFNGGSTDAFLARLTSSGALQFASLIGGSSTDTANGVAVKADGSAWIVGETSSSNLPLFGVAYQSVSRGNLDAFLAHVNATGTVTYSTYFGGSGDDRAVAVTLDGSGEVYFTGGTTSGNFPAANAFRNFNKGMQDAFVAKLSSDGAALRYSTYLGGSYGVPGQGELGNWIAVDTAGAAYIAGTTSSSDFPIAGTSIQPAFGGGATDAFIAKISAAGTSLLYSSFFGGASSEEGTVGALATDGSFYFGGNTSSPGLTPYDSLQSTLGGDFDGFFVKLNSSLSSIASFSYLGYTGTESLTGMAVTSSSVVLAGNSSSASWLPSGGFKGWYDGWVMRLAESASGGVQMNSSPPGIPFTVSGTGCSPASATTPALLQWQPGSSCTVTVPASQDLGDTRRTFQSWNDSATNNPRTFVASASVATYSMHYATQYRLTRSASPPVGGTVSGADGFYNAGASLQLVATPSAGYQFGGWSGTMSGAANPVTVAMNSPQSVTANFLVLTSFQSIVATPLTVSGTGCAPGSYTAPVTLAWTYGATCTVSFNTTVTSGDTRYVFAKWADGSSASPRNFTAGTPAEYTLTWNTEYRLTRTVTGSGTISGADGFYAAGSTVQLTATPASGYQFAGWSNAATGTINPLSLLMNGAKTIAATFTQKTVPVTINGNITGVQFSVSGTGCVAGTYTAPQTFTWAEGLSCTISTTSVQQTADTRWTFQRWGDLSTANSRVITATPPSVTQSMTFGAEYKLTRLVSGGGSVNGADGFYAAGTVVQLTATAASGYQFTGWSGASVSTTNPLSLTINGPATITANFSAAPTTVSIGSNVPAQFTISGTGCPTGTYTAPTDVVWTNGAACTVSTSSPQGGPNTRYVFASWNDGVLSGSRVLTAAPGLSKAMSFTTEHKLTRTVSGNGSVSGSDTFYAAGSTVQLTATPASGYTFTGWSGAASGTTNPVSVVMNSPQTVTATFAPAPVGVAINANLATQFVVSAGTGCPAGSYTTPATLSITNGSTCTINVTTPQGTGDTQLVFSGWADGPTTASRAITATPNATYTIAMNAQHRLTRTISGQGSVSGSDGMYAAGTTLQLTATAQPGYQFTGWSGAATGTANPVSVTMNGPKTIVATFAPVSTGMRFESNATAVVSVSGSGCPAGAYATPVTLSWTTGTTCTLNVQGPAANADSRWTFSKWADGPTTTSRSITAAAGAVYTLVYTAEYRLSRSVSGSGSVSGTDGFYAAGTPLQITATPQSGFQFTGWSGAVSGSANPLSFVMDGPKTLVASFGALTSSIRIESNIAAQFSVSGAGCPTGSYTAPVTLSWTTGSACAVSIVSPQGAGDTRYLFTRWTDGLTANPRSITATSGALYNITMSAQYRLTRSVAGPGVVSGADGYYDGGASVQLTATPQTGFQFAGWSGSATGAVNPLTVVMNGPKSVVANFTAAASTVRFDSNTPGQIVVNGANCPVGTYTTPVNLSWTTGLSCAVSIPSPQGGGDSRLVFQQWSDGSPANPRLIAASPGAVYAVVFGVEYRLTRSVSGPGTVSGADGFYAASSDVQLTATPAPGQQFLGWSGSASGAANPLTLRMNGPMNVVASFGSAMTVTALSPMLGSGPNVTYTATFSHAGGANQLYLGYVLFLPTSNVVQYTAKGSCLVEYNRISNGMRLIDDPGTGWLGPLPGVPIRPGAGVLRNSQCTLNISGASATISGNTMTVSAPVTFHSGVSPIMATFLQAADIHGNWTGMTQFGNWRYAGGTPRPGPALVNVSASAAAGSAATYTFTASHSSGQTSITMMNLLIGERIVDTPACHIVYFPGNDTLNLVKDDVSGLVSDAGVPRGSGAPLANRYCSVNTAAAVRSAAGSNVTLTVPVTFQPAGFGGVKTVFANVFDGVGRLSHWVQTGTMTVQ